MLVVAAFGAFAQARAQVALDGSLGRAGAVPGPNFAITADLGRQAGANLFHSFSQFNIARGEVATFSGPASVANIISRVTGGASSIDGVLRSTVDGAAFYLFNPAGVAFGPNASIDVGGAFHVSSAHALRFADGARFDAANPAASTLSAAMPEAFGFLGGQGAVTFTGSRLATRAGSALLVAGGDIELRDGAVLNAPSAALGLASVAGAGEVSFGPVGITAVTGPRGDILLSDGIAYTDGVGGRPAGPVQIVGGRIVLAGESTVSASTLSGGAGGDVAISTGELAVLDESSIMAVTWGSGDAGSIRVDAQRGVRVEDRGAITAQSQGTGAAGDIAVRADSLTVAYGYIGTTTFHSGHGGSIAIDVGELFLDGGYITTNSSWIGSGDAGSLAVRASRGIVIFGNIAGLSATTAQGRGGSIFVQTPSLTLERGGHINTYTTGAGNAGDITLVVGDFQARDLGYVSASSRDEATGRGGNVTLRADTVTLSASGQILSYTTGPGHGGNIVVTAPRIDIDTYGRISAAAYAGGRGGSITVETGELSLTRMGYLDVSSRGSGAGGDLAVNATGGIRISDRDGDYASGLFAMARGTGDGGTITVRAPRLVVDGAVITATTTGPGRGGAIAIEARDVVLRNGALVSAESTGTGNAGSIRVAAADSLVVSSNAVIATQTVRSDGGDIAVEGQGVVLLRNGAMATSVQGGAGDGGNITIAMPLHVVLDHGAVIANAYGGDGGNIAIDSSCFIASPGSVVEASSQLGVSGTITVTAPSVDIGAGLGVLPANFFDATRLLREACAARAGESENSFVAVGRGGLPESAWGAYRSPQAREDKEIPATATPCGAASR